MEGMQELNNHAHVFGWLDRKTFDEKTSGHEVLMASYNSTISVTRPGVDWVRGLSAHTKLAHWAKA